MHNRFAFTICNFDFRLRISKAIIDPRAQASCLINAVYTRMYSYTIRYPFTLSISDLHIAISIYIHVLHYGNPFSVRLCTVSLSACYPVSSYSMRYKFYLSDIPLTIAYAYATLCQPEYSELLTNLYYILSLKMFANYPMSHSSIIR